MLYRRIPRNCDSDKVVPPSWSWAGWKGEIRGFEWAYQWDYLSLAFRQGTVLWKLNSTIEWSYGESREDRQPVEVSSHRYRRCLTDTSIPLPPGWSRRPAAAGVTHGRGSASQDPNSNRTKHTHFVHIRFPGVNCCYPIPLPETDQQNHSQTSPCFLFGRTRRGCFKASYIINGFSQARILHELFLQNTSADLLISLHDNDGRWAGFMQLYDRALVSSLNSTSMDDSMDDSSELELVSISTRTAMSSTSLLHFYNVLWIEWKEGIAYRKGLGRISKGAWDRQATEWIDLTLG